MQPVSRLYIRGVKRLWDQPGGRALALAVVAFAVTALVALWNVDNRDGITCGSWLMPNDKEAAYADAKKNSEYASAELALAIRGDYSGLAFKSDRDAQVADCRAARSERTPTVTILFIGSAALLVVGLIRRYPPSGGRAPQGDAATG